MGKEVHVEFKVGHTEKGQVTVDSWKFKTWAWGKQKHHLPFQ